VGSPADPPHLAFHPFSSADALREGPNLSTMTRSTTSPSAPAAAVHDGRVRVLVLRSSGTNCDFEAVRAFELCGAEATRVHTNRLAERPELLDECDVLFLPGGFSHGDYVAAGRVMAAEVRHLLGDRLHRFVANGGYVIGVCNGFQVLVDLGLLEGQGRAAHERRIALAPNHSGRFECRWVHLRSEDCAADWLDQGLVWPVPVAHAEGRVALADGALAELEANGQIALRYVAADGSELPTGDAGYPACPNGAVANIAGLCDPTGRVLGLMPHPERNLDPWNHPTWTRLGERQEGEGLAFFRGLVAAARVGR
jgi:phosphoribosylformylglycinamidine synthase subunit PurQ / glutaminase